MFFEFLLDLLGFLLKFVIVIAVISIPIAMIVSLINKEKKSLNGAGLNKGFIVVEDLKKAAKDRQKLIKKRLKETNPDRILSRKEKKVGLKKSVVETDALELAEVAESTCNNEVQDADATQNYEQNSHEQQLAKVVEQESLADVQPEDIKIQASNETKVAQTKDVKHEVANKAETAVQSTEDKTVSVDKDDNTAKDVEAEVVDEKSQNEAEQDKAAKAKECTTSVAEGCVANSGIVGGDAKAAVVEGQDESACPFKRIVAKVMHKTNAGNKIVALSKKKKDKKSKLKASVEAKLAERQQQLDDLNILRDEGEFCPQNLYVIDFKGSTSGSEVRELRLKIDTVLDVATENDEVIINLNSPGGMVNSYGLCASQIKRLRDHGIFVTVTVDEVAASGGYMMACVANKIVAAPFAYIGSIGVIAGIPNFRRVLNKYNVDYEQITAGKYKRTLSMLGENTEEGRQKFKEELEAIHNRFKELVIQHRPQIDLEKVATGEHWLAVDAMELGLVDELLTSDEYIAQRMSKTFDSALKIKWRKPKDKNPLSKILPKMKLPAIGLHDAQDQINKMENDSFMNYR